MGFHIRQSTPASLREAMEAAQNYENSAQSLRKSLKTIEDSAQSAWGGARCQIKAPHTQSKVWELDNFLNELGLYLLHKVLLGFGEHLIVLLFILCLSSPSTPEALSLRPPPALSFASSLLVSLPTRKSPSQRTCFLCHLQRSYWLLYVSASRFAFDGFDITGNRRSRWFTRCCYNGSRCCWRIVFGVAELDDSSVSRWRSDHLSVITLRCGGGGPEQDGLPSP